MVTGRPRAASRERGGSARDSKGIDVSRRLVSWAVRLLRRRTSAAAAALIGLAGAVVMGWLGLEPPFQREAPPGGAVVGRASVRDGDTLIIRDRKIRLAGLDAPEMGQSCEAEGRSYRCGQRAALALDGLIGSRTVHCTGKARDRYRRLLARCRVGETSLNAWMVEQGWAIAYRRYSKEYVPAEQRARAARRGIWAGTFEEPERFRARRRAAGGK